MTKATATYNINIDLIQKITHRSRQTGKSKSEIANAALMKGLNLTEDDENKIQKIATELESLKDIVKKIYRVDD